MASKPKTDTIQTPPPPRMDTTPVDVSLDSRFVETIMTGEMCLRGVRQSSQVMGMAREGEGVESGGQIGGGKKYRGDGKE